MAGAGYKLFNTGDVLTAAQVNTYLQEQVVMVFASATARTTALSGVLAEGMVSYLQDTNAVEVYNGSAWVSIGSSGDITAVTAGTGLSGGGTSGDVTLSLSTPVAATNGGTAQTTYTTGDLLYASGTNTLAKRGIGSTGQVLTVSGGVPTWANAASGSTFSGALVFNNATTTISNNSEAFFTYNSEVYDTDNYHSTSSNTGRLTIPSGKSGYYQVYALARFAANANGVRTMQITQGSGQTSVGCIEQTPGGVSSNSGFYYSTVRYAAAADYFECKIYQTSGGNLDVLGGDSQMNFGIVYLGA